MVKEVAFLFNSDGSLVLFAICLILLWLIIKWIKS